MADRVSASISIGGVLTVAQFNALLQLVEDERLSAEADYEPFELSPLLKGEALHLHAFVFGGVFEALEAWCHEHRVPFVRWSGGLGCEWGAERVVFDGSGDPVGYDADEYDRIFVDRATVERLGSVEAILAHFDAADAVLPPLIISDRPAA